MRHILIGFAVVLGLTAVPAAPASALAAGSIAIEGTATLPRFPCPPPPNGPGCTGTFAGNWAGHADGVDETGGAYDVTWLANDRATASFTYFELQCVEPSTVLGAATGSGSAVAGPGQITGSWYKYAGEIPRYVNTVRVTFTFVWTRVGTSALLTFDNFLLEIEVAGLGWRPVSRAVPPAVATFVPTSTDIHPPSCATPLTNFQGQIAGVLPLAA